MNREQFYTYLDNPDKLNEQSLKVLEEIIEEYPYFQTVHLLYLKNLHEIGHLKFNKQLRISSSYVANREILYEFLHPGGEKKLSLLNDKIYPEKTKPELINDIDEAKPVKTELEDRTSERKTSKEKEKKQDDDIRQRLSNELLKKIDISPKHLLDFAEFDNTEILQRPFSLDESNEDIIPEKKSDEPTVPIAIETESYHSFNDWLKLISENKLEKHHEKKITEEFTANDRAKMKNQSSLIDDFIKAQPKIKAPQHSIKPQEDISRESILDSDDFITETLAKIYINQKHFNKAILAYEKLSLKYPEKNIYFAHQIKKIKDLKNE